MTTDWRALCAELVEAYEIELDELQFDNRLAKRARAALAEPEPEGPMPQPADGEVAELVTWLREEADDYDCIGETLASPKCRRAADLLERLSPPQPVPVSERLPGPEDCDAEGRCWLCGKIESDWRLINPAKSGVPQLKYCFSHWLPAHALPLPS